MSINWMLSIIQENIFEELHPRGGSNYPEISDCINGSYQEDGDKIVCWDTVATFHLGNSRIWRDYMVPDTDFGKVYTTEEKLLSVLEEFGTDMFFEAIKSIAKQTMESREDEMAQWEESRSFTRYKYLLTYG